MRVLIFGDSITQASAVEGGGWADRVRDHYENPKYPEDNAHSVICLGVGGDATDNLLERFSVEARARKKEYEMLIIFAIGANDSRIKNDRNYMEVETYRDNLKVLLNQANELTQNVVCVGLVPCVDRLTNPVSWSSTCYKNERLEEFDTALRDFCRENQLRFIEVFQPYKVNSGFEGTLPDGVHPDKKGHEVIFNLVRPVLDEVLA